MLMLLLVLLICVTFATISIAPDMIALQRQHHWRWWWRRSGDEGPFWPGTRVPRRPRLPLLPTRGATAHVEDEEGY